MSPGDPVRLVWHRAISPDLEAATQRLTAALDGQLICLEIGQPLQILLQGRRWWTTSAVRQIHPGKRLTEIWTDSTVYRLLGITRAR